jgi:hypothetical protein
MKISCVDEWDFVRDNIVFDIYNGYLSSTIVSFFSPLPVFLYPIPKQEVDASQRWKAKIYVNLSYKIKFVKLFLYTIRKKMRLG